MVWLLTYTYPNDKVKLYVEVCLPHVGSFKQVRRWWRKSDFKHMKLVKGVLLRLTDELKYRTAKEQNALRSSGKLDSKNKSQHNK